MPKRAAGGPGHLLAELQRADELVVEPTAGRLVERFDDDRLPLQLHAAEKRRHSPDEGGDESADRGDNEQDHERPGRELQCPIEQEPDEQAAGKREHRER